MTDTISIPISVDDDNDGDLSPNEELFLVDSEPVGGSTLIYLNSNSGKTILPTGYSAIRIFYIPF